VKCTFFRKNRPGELLLGHVGYQCAPPVLNFCSKMYGTVPTELLTTFLDSDA